MLVHSVMPDFMSGIHDFFEIKLLFQVVDGRSKSGHDVCGWCDASVSKTFCFNGCFLPDRS